MIEHAGTLFWDLFGFKDQKYSSYENNKMQQLLINFVLVVKLFFDAIIINPSQRIRRISNN
jgi:hypothetical protein